MLHDNSIKSLRETEKFKRRRQIIDAHTALPDGATDREIAAYLGVADMNFVRPRTTDLINDKVLVETGKKKDTLTNRTVRVCALYWRAGQSKFSFKK